MTDADLDALRRDLHITCVRFSEVCQDLEVAAAGVAEAETALRIAAECAGISQQHDTPDVRDLCVELLHGRAAALRPWVPFVSRRGMELAEQRLRAAPSSTPRTPCSGSESQRRRVPGAVKGTGKDGQRSPEIVGKASATTTGKAGGT